MTRPKGYGRYGTPTRTPHYRVETFGRDIFGNIVGYRIVTGYETEKRTLRTFTGRPFAEMRDAAETECASMNAAHNPEPTLRSARA